MVITLLTPISQACSALEEILTSRFEKLAKSACLTGSNVGVRVRLRRLHGVVKAANPTERDRLLVYRAFGPYWWATGR